MNSILQAVELLLQLVSGLATTFASLQPISDLITKAKAEGRDTFTDDEWKTITDAADAARARLANAPPPSAAPPAPAPEGIGL